MTTASDLRAEMGRRRISIYKLAAMVGVHPGRLGMILSGKLPLEHALAQRIIDAIVNQELALVK